MARQAPHRAYHAAAQAHGLVGLARPLRFTGEILAADGGGAFVEIPFDIEKEFGSKRPKVKALIGGEPYRGTAVRMGTDCHLLLVLKSIREKIGKDIGDQVKVVLEIDIDERVVEIPLELEKTLKKNKAAREAFAKASFTTRKEIAKGIAEAKRPETRERRLEQALERLSASSTTKTTRKS